MFNIKDILTFMKFLNDYKIECYMDFNNSYVVFETQGSPKRISIPVYEFDIHQMILNINRIKREFNFKEVDLDVRYK